MTKLKLNEKSVEILEAIYNKGGKLVRISATEVRQNKNYYFRVVRLEDLGLIEVERISGEKSFYTLTEEGYKFLAQKCN